MENKTVFVVIDTECENIEDCVWGVIEAPNKQEAKSILEDAIKDELGWEDDQDEDDYVGLTPSDIMDRMEIEPYTIRRKQ